MIIVATGRHHLDALPIVADMGCPVYLVTSNGARIHSPAKELLYSFDIKSDDIKSVLDLKISSLKTKLPHLEVVASNDNDGVAKYLTKTLLS